MSAASAKRRRGVPAGPVLVLGVGGCSVKVVQPFLAGPAILVDHPCA